MKMEKHKKSAYKGTPSSMSTKVCNLRTISDASYENGEVIHQEEPSDISVKERQRHIMLDKENLGTLSEISEKGESTRICKINEVDSELQTYKRRRNKNFIISPCLSEVQELETQNLDSHEYEKRKSRRSLDGTIGDQVEGASLPCLVRIENRFQNNPETVRSEAEIGLNSTDERTRKTKGILRENSHPLKKQSMRSICEMSGSLQRDISAERKTPDKTRQLCDGNNTKQVLNSKKNERNDSLENTKHSRVKRGSDRDKNEDGNESSTKSGSKLQHSQSKCVDRVKSKAIESVEEEENNKCGDHGENSFANEDKVAEIAKRRLSNNGGVKYRASVGEDKILRNIRRMSRVSQTPIRTHSSQFVLDFSSGVRNGLDGKACRNLSIISLPNDPQTITPRTRKLQQLHLEKTIVFRYSERLFGCLACTNCCYRSETLDEQASHHKSKHSSHLPYFCMTCFCYGSETGFRSKEELERHLLESEHSIIE